MGRSMATSAAAKHRESWRHGGKMERSPNGVRRLGKVRRPGEVRRPGKVRRPGEVRRPGKIKKPGKVKGPLPGKVIEGQRFPQGKGHYSHFLREGIPAGGLDCRVSG